ncbi:uncharacterized protein LOC123678697 [Harmonia axyridis]|uniref:uncharacterized protein LOC123678697 n=1 Tax=Harmonia axyridis TaxID=115357 RepID=UPI001E275FEB|nr:uncharacterized protein LOC123678697 [Harmonia axyridis]
MTLGLDEKSLLSSEIDDLGKRLENVRQSLTIIIDVAEEQFNLQAENKGKIDETKDLIHSIKASTNEITASTENHEQKLTVVRDNLLAFGKAEARSKPPGPIPTCQTERSIPEMSHVSIDEETVEKYLLELKVDTSPGRDGITSRLLKYCAKAMAVPLSIIFSKSFRDSCLKCDWLSATVTPIFKKGDKLSPLNYRPISLVSSVAIVIERIICDQLIKFAMEHSIIPREQHGFIPGRSTLTNLLTGLSAWTESYDFSKAFDRVPHRHLISKLEHLGVRGNLQLFYPTEHFV